MSFNCTPLCTPLFIAARSINHPKRPYFPPRHFLQDPERIKRFLFILDPIVHARNKGRRILSYITVFCSKDFLLNFQLIVVLGKCFSTKHREEQRETKIQARIDLVPLPQYPENNGESAIRINEPG